jgi:putative addiction module killer protein
MVTPVVLSSQALLWRLRNNTSTQTGRVLTEEWLLDLHAPEAARVTGAIIRMEQGNFGNVKGVGQGVFECRLDFGPGYRIYFGRDGEQIIILLGGGTKKRQHRDIELAIAGWQDYKRRKKVGQK